MIPAYQLGWMAGIVDLRGRIARKNNKTRATQQITLSVETKELGVIKALGRMTGTNPEFRDSSPLAEWMRRGCVEHCPEQHIHSARDGLEMPAVARWTVTGAAMVVVLENLAPFLLVDRGYSLAVDDTKGTVVFQGQGAAAVVRALHRLQALGWEIPEYFAERLPEAVEAEVVAA